MSSENETPMNLAEMNVVAALRPQQRAGRPAARAIALSRNNGLDLDQLDAPTLARCVIQVYASGLDALEIAVILRELDFSAGEIAMALRTNFPAQGVLATGAILLDPQVYPGWRRANLVHALEEAGYAAVDARQAANILFPLMFTVQSAQGWQITGVVASASRKTTIAYQSGTWCASPRAGACTGAGVAEFRAPAGYPLEGAPEGALIGRVGTCVFLVGDLGQVPAGLAGPLELCINNDLGLADNRGSLTVKVSSAM